MLESCSLLSFFGRILMGRIIKTRHSTLQCACVCLQVSVSFNPKHVHAFLYFNSEHVLFAFWNIVSCVHGSILQALVTVTYYVILKM